MTDQEIDQIYAESTGQTLREQDKHLAHAFARSLLSRAIPEGHVVVPKEPTMEMEAEGFKNITGLAHEVWTAMIAVAPSITAQASGVSEEKINAVEKLLLAAEDHFDYGGSEDSDGVLYPGHVDFPKLRADVRAVLAAAPANKEG